jgi:hypothetical protein
VIALLGRPVIGHHLCCSQLWTQTQSFSRKTKRRFARLLGVEVPYRPRTGFSSRVLLGDLAVLHGFTVLPLNGFHLIFEAELQLLQPDFFQLFVVG